MSKPDKQQKKPSQNSNHDLILGWLDKLSTHFGVPLEEEQAQIFLEALRENTPYQINRAFSRCLNECLFMPKLAEVHQKMPDPEYGDAFVSAKVQEMMENIRQVVPDPKTWEVEERPGTMYRWYGDPAGYKMLLKAYHA